MIHAAKRKRLSRCSAFVGRFCLLAVVASLMALNAAPSYGQPAALSGDAANRLATYPASLAPIERQSWLDQLLKDVLARKKPRLTAEESSSAVGLLRVDFDFRVRERLWRLLAVSPRYELAVGLARQSVLDTNYNPRWSAFQYLRLIDPQICEALLENGIVKPDADLTYVVADFIFQKDRDRGLAMMIDLIPHVAHTMNHRLFDSISQSVALQGGEAELAQLRRREPEPEYGRAFRLVADMLAGELAQKSKSTGRSNK